MSSKIKEVSAGEISVTYEKTISKKENEIKLEILLKGKVLKRITILTSRAGVSIFESQWY